MKNFFMELYSTREPHRPLIQTDTFKTTRQAQDWFRLTAKNIYYQTPEFCWRLMAYNDNDDIICIESYEED